MTIPEAAASLGLAPSTLRFQIKRGKLKARKQGGWWFIAEPEVERYRRDNLGIRTGGRKATG